MTTSTPRAGNPLWMAYETLAMLLGLGMRESSGEHCTGRDTSATNTTAATAEAVAYVAGAATAVPRPAYLGVVVSEGVVVNGTRQWEASARFYPATPTEVAVGRNPVGGTACAPTFSGAVLGVKRIRRSRSGVHASRRFPLRHGVRR